MSALNLFLPPFRDWFRARLGGPTEIQSLAWPVIASGQNTLALAPTGSGKTLAAFLWFLNQFASGALPTGATRVLYLSPLRALNNDMQRNLLAPLAELQEVFSKQGIFFPEVQVRTRSGDTGQSERRQMLLHPPEILITTPESLNILLASGAAERMLGGLAAVILDEVHATAETRRGAHLITAVERLVRHAGEFQRIGLSATVCNPETVAAFIGGSSRADEWQSRPVRILQAQSQAEYVLDVCPVSFEAEAGKESGQESAGSHAKKGEGAREEGKEQDAFWDALADQIREIIGEGRRVLCFTESRRLAEKTAALLNEQQESPLAFAHHGSLSREIRLSIEDRFKRGLLPCVVATSSLELGIDIGDLDEVILLQCPGSSSSALQRLGRAGHSPGLVSRGRAIPLHSLDLLRLTVLRSMIADRDLEPIRPPECPLDLLAQILLSMACGEEAMGRSLDEEDALACLRRTYTYRNLDARQFQLVLDMLEGRFQGLSFSELRPRLRREGGRLLPMPGARLHLYQAGGTIPERGYFRLRTPAGPGGDRGIVLGELDEEFVWERKAGDRIVLGSRLWKIRNIGENDVEVEPAQEGWGMNPFWRADGRDIDNGFADRIASTMEQWSGEFESNQEAFEERLILQEGTATAGALLDLFRRHRTATGRGLPHRHHILCECIVTDAAESGGYPIFLHTLWGGRRNRPFTIALVAALEDHYGVPISHFAGDEGILLILPERPGPDVPASLFAALPVADLMGRLEEGLPRSSLFGMHFRQAAGTALLLPSRGFGRRTPFWLHRLVASRLLDSLSGRGEFPVTVEAWRTLLRDRFDLEGLRSRLEEIENGEIQLSRCDITTPGPLTAGLEFQRAGELMYKPDGTGGSGHRTSFFEELVMAGNPPVSGETVQQFENRSLRLAQIYRPTNAEELQDWLSERSFLPLAEWRLLSEGLSLLELHALQIRIGTESLVATEDGAALLLHGFAGAQFYEDEAAREDQDVRVRIQHHRDEMADRFGSLPDAVDLIERFLSWYGPVPVSRLEALFGASAPLDDLVAEGRAVRGALLRGDAAERICHRTNIERLHRLARQSVRSAPPLLPLSDLPLFLATHQGLVREDWLTDREKEANGLQEHFERLFGYPAPASLWETDILPARLCGYRTALLDSLMQESDLAWTGIRRSSQDDGTIQERGTGGLHPVFFFLAAERALFFSPSNNDSIEDAGSAGPGSRSDQAKTHLRNAEPSGPRLEDLYPDGFPKETGSLIQRSSLSSIAFEAWMLARISMGLIASASPRLLRRAVRTRFRPDAKEGERARRGRWGEGRDVSLSFRPVVVPVEDSLEREEWNRQRARILLDRYGILWRELLQREMGLLQWKSVYRTLCRMELAGEVMAGTFFEGMEGLQFLSPKALRTLRSGLDDKVVYWMNAKDPASLCGIPGFSMPARLSTTRLVYRGPNLTAAFLRNGRDLRFFQSPAESRFLLPLFRVLLTRDFDPPVRWSVETVNQERSDGTEFRPLLEEAGFRWDGRSMVLYRS